MNKIWYDLKELIEREVSKVVMKNELIPQDIEMLDKVTDIAKDICCMEKDESEKFGGYPSEKRFAMSYDNSNGYPMNGMNLPNVMYDNQRNSFDGNSYGRGNQGNQSNRNMSGANQYSNNSSMHSIEDRIVHEMELMMDNTGSDYEKQKLQEYIRKMRSGM